MMFLSFQNLIVFEVKHKKLAILLTVDTDRLGNQVDVDRITKLLPNLGYELIQYVNPTRSDMIQSLQNLQKKTERTYHVTYLNSESFLRVSAFIYEM